MQNILFIRDKKDDRNIFLKGIVFELKSTNHQDMFYKQIFIM